MERTQSEAQKRAAFAEAAKGMHERLSEWRKAHPQASFDEIAAQVSAERKVLMGELMGELSGSGAAELVEVVCAECGGQVQNKGKKKREVLHREGTVQLERTYYYCPRCQRGFFPLDEGLALGKHGWSPEMVRLAVRQGVEIASFKRGADNFTELTGVPMSDSSLQRLTVAAGEAVVAAEAQEAEAMVRIPQAEEAVLWRQIPEPDSEVMAVSADGVMVHLIEEGWKEVKVMSVSAVTSGEQEETAPAERLSQHSYRAGLWEAKTFTNHFWAESARRGLEKAKQIVCVNDGAAWSWAMVFICFARRIEVLDWWHLLEYLWQIVGEAMPRTSPQAMAWIETQKAALARSQLRLVFHHIRQLYPRPAPLPEPVRQAVGYLWHNRRRMDYAAYRQAGFPIGSGTVESAAKTLVQQRMKQAGMRWSRSGAQAMLALRARLLSDRWLDVPI